MGCCGKIVSGAVGLAKAAAQEMGIPVDQAPPEVVAERRNICRECPEATRNPATLDTPAKGLAAMSRCKVCTCFISMKSMIASEKCPLGKWAAVSEATHSPNE